MDKPKSNKKSNFLWFFASCCESQKENLYDTKSPLATPIGNMNTSIIQQEDAKLCKTQDNPTLKSTINSSNGGGTQIQSLCGTANNNSPDRKSKNTLCETKCGDQLYPKNTLFFLGPSKKRILAKITKKRLLKCSSFSASKTDSIFSSNNSISLSKDKRLPTFGSVLKNSNKPILERIPRSGSIYENDKEYGKVDEGIPEQIAVHIGKRLASNIIVDGICGIGNTTIQLAKHSKLVIAIDKDPSKIKCSRNQAKLHDLSEKIDFIVGDFLSMKRILGDVVFLDLMGIIIKSTNIMEKFSLFKHVQVNLVNLAGKALANSQSMVLRLPKETDFEEIAILFNEIHGKYKPKNHERFCIEIEKVYLDGELECLLVYFGDHAQIKKEEEQEVIYDFISLFSKNQIEWKKKYPLNFVVRIIKMIGLYNFLQSIFIIEDEFNILKTPIIQSESLFDMYIQNILKQNIITQEEIKKIYMHEAKSIFANYQNSSICTYSPLYFKSSDLSPVQGSKNLIHNQASRKFHPDYTHKTTPDVGISFSPSPILSSNHLIGLNNDATSMKENNLTDCKVNKSTLTDLLKTHQCDKQVSGSASINNSKNNKNNNNNTSFSLGVHCSGKHCLKTSREIDDFESPSYSVSAGFFKESPLDETNNQTIFNHSKLSKGNNNTRNEEDDDEYEIFYMNESSSINKINKPSNIFDDLSSILNNKEASVKSGLCSGSLMFSNGIANINSINAFNKKF